MENNIKPYYYNEIDRISQKITSENADFVFSVIADTHLDNSLDVSLENMGEVDKKVGFQCMIHLGDFLNGNIPKNYTKKILKNDMKRFCSVLKSGRFFPAQGNHDGFTDNIGKTRNDMALDEDWYEATKFTENYENVSRPHKKPYFYADYPDIQVRIIVSCSFYYEFVDGIFEKRYGTSDEQVEWFKNEALNLDKEWTVIIVSHDSPFNKFYDDAYLDEDSRINGKRMFEILLSKKNEKKFNVAAWLIGHFHGEFVSKVNGINMIIVPGETAYKFQLGKMPDGGEFLDRKLNTATEDSWKGAVLDKKNKVLKLFAFGAGEDITVYY